MLTCSLESNPELTVVSSCSILPALNKDNIVVLKLSLNNQPMFNRTGTNCLYEQMKNQINRKIYIDNQTNKFTEKQGDRKIVRQFAS